jgi:hypothetical protein
MDHPVKPDDDLKLPASIIGQSVGRPIGPGHLFFSNPL